MSGTVPCMWWDLPSHPGFLLASSPGLPTVQFLIACSMQNWTVGRSRNEASFLPQYSYWRQSSTGGRARDCEWVHVYITTYLFCSPAHRRALSLSWRTHDGHSMQNPMFNLPHALYILHVHMSHFSIRHRPQIVAAQSGALSEINVAFK